MGLAENTPQCANRNLTLIRHDSGVDTFARISRKLNVAALLADFDKASRFKPALDFAEGLRLKPPQPQPRWCEP